MLTRVSHPALRFVLFFVLSLMLAVPARVLAATPSHISATADPALVATYTSEVLTTEDETHVVVTLSFYDDNSFELAIESQDDDTTTVGYGTYEETDDGVSLSIVGADEQDFDTPIDLALTTGDDEGTIVIPGSPDGMMGDKDIILTASDASADTSGDSADTSKDTADETTDVVTDTTDTEESEAITGTEEADTEESEAITDTEEAGTEESEAITDTEESDDISNTVGGAYVSPVQPTENSAGVVYLLNMLPDGSASLNSDYLNLQPPVYEIGTWTDNGDQSVTLEITGTVEQTYDDPIDIDFMITDDGVLTTETTILYPLSLLNADMTEQDGADEESESSSDALDDSGEDTHIYVAAVTLPDTDTPTNIYMLIYNDGTVELTDEEQTDTLSGEWTLEEQTLTVTITSNQDGDLDEPVDLTFELNDDDSFVATEYPVDVFGEEAPVFSPIDKAGTSASDAQFDVYESDQLPSADTDGMVVSLILSDDNMALLSIDMMNGDEPPLEYGEWKKEDDGTVTVTINEGPDGAYDEPHVFTFTENAYDSSLTLTDESTEVFGDTEVVLNKVDSGE